MNIEQSIQYSFYEALAGQQGFESIEHLLESIPEEKRLPRPSSILDQIANAFIVNLGFNSIDEFLNRDKKVKKEIDIVVHGNVPLAGTSTIISIIQDTLNHYGFEVKTEHSEDLSLVKARREPTVKSLIEQGLKITLVEGWTDGQLIEVVE